MSLCGHSNDKSIWLRDFFLHESSVPIHSNTHHHIPRLQIVLLLSCFFNIKHMLNRYYIQNIQMEIRVINKDENLARKKNVLS